MINSISLEKERYAAIIDPLDQAMMATIKTTQMLIGKDVFCTEYLKAVRAGEIQA